MAWVWFLTGVLTALACLYWRDRALKAEREAELNMESMKMWQKHACEWSAHIQELEAAQEQPAPAPVVRDQATAFMLAYQTFWHLMPDWQVKHD